MGEGGEEEALVRGALEALSAGLPPRQRAAAIREMAGILIASYAARGAEPPRHLARIVAEPLEGCAGEEPTGPAEPA